jgi:hypothetical protein
VKQGFFLKRAVATLCVGLLFVFSQAAVASTVGSVQHLFAGQGEHHHMAFSDIALDDHHDADHDHQPSHDADHHGDHDGDRAPASHHHHHGDFGSSVFVLSVVGPDLPVAALGPQSVVLGELTIHVRQSLPERPPKHGLSSI